MLTLDQLENVCVSLAKQQQATAVILLIVEPEGTEKRVELVSASRGGTIEDLAGVLRKLAKQCEDGDGMPLGNHGHYLGSDR